MKRFAVLIYGVVAYLLFFVTFCYLIGFTGNLFVPKGIEGVLEVPLWQAIVTNLLLVILFGAQHSLMARAWFKKWWTKYVPEPMERSTYVLFTVVALITLFVFWQPMGGTVWSIESGFWVGIIMAIFALGWTLVLVSSFLINHFDLFGLRQVWLYFRKKPYTHLEFKIKNLYSYIRHPLYLGLLLGLWAAPVMSVTRFLFASMLTIYVLVGIYLEEKDMLRLFGERYSLYKSKVPKLIPTFVNRWKKPAYETIMKGGD